MHSRHRNSRPNVHGKLLWTDARSSGVALLRNARLMIAFAEIIDAADGDEPRGFDPSSRSHVGASQADPLYEQAHRALELCTELAGVTLDDGLHRACRAMLWELDSYGEAPLLEFTLEPRASTTVHRSGVVGL
jgi:hypothetical protein